MILSSCLDLVRIEPEDMSATRYNAVMEAYIPSSHGDNQVHRYQQHTLEPVRFAIGNEIVHLKN